MSQQTQRFVPLVSIIFLLCGALFILPPRTHAATIACCMTEDSDTQSQSLEAGQTCEGVLGSRWHMVDLKYCPDISVPVDEKKTIFKPNVGIPESTFSEGSTTTVTGTTLGEWIGAVYAFLSGAMAVIAALMVMWGGIKWVTASGNSGRISDAKDTMYSAIIALILTLGAYILLFTINPGLVKYKDLSTLMKPIQRIEMSLSDIPLRFSETLFGNATLRAEKDSFNTKPCPTEAEMANGVTVYVTGYYRPGWDESGGYSSFVCNVGMQCSCERKSSQTCSAGGLSWKACDLSKLTPVNYCNATASGSEPVEYTGIPSSATYFTAAGSSCFGFGTTFSLARMSDGTPTTAQDSIFRVNWSVQDRGSDIRGLHVDLFLGTGQAARNLAIGATGKVMMKVAQFCSPSKDGGCHDLTPDVVIPP